MAGSNQFSPTGISLDNGNTWSALGTLRTVPGASYGITPKPVAGRVATSNGGAVTVPLLTVTTGKTFYLTDIFASLAASTSDMQIQVAGITVWWSFLNTLYPVCQPLGSPIACASGSLVQVVFGTSGAGTPNAYFFVGGYEA
jgi:hypothetical protein